MKKDIKKDDGKQPYEKPRLRIIELAAEEILAVGCKTQSAGPNQGSPPPCVAGICSDIGS